MTVKAMEMVIGTVMGLVIGGACALWPGMEMLKGMFRWPIFLPSLFSVSAIAMGVGSLSEAFF